MNNLSCMSVILRDSFSSPSPVCVFLSRSPVSSNAPHSSSLLLTHSHVCHQFTKDEQLLHHENNSQQELATLTHSKLSCLGVFAFIQANQRRKKECTMTTGCLCLGDVRLPQAGSKAVVSFVVVIFFLYILGGGFPRLSLLRARRAARRSHAGARVSLFKRQRKVGPLCCT